MNYRLDVNIGNTYTFVNEVHHGLKDPTSMGLFQEGQPIDEACGFILTGKGNQSERSM